MLACAIALSFTAHIFAVFPFDLKISHELQEEKNPVFALSMQGVSAIGDTWIGIVIVVAVSAFFIARGQLLEAGFILATLSSFVLIAFVKVSVARPRPPYFFQDPPVSCSPSTSIVSRAAMSSFLSSSLVLSRILHGFTRPDLPGYLLLQSVVPLSCSSVLHGYILGHTGQVM